VHSRIPHYTFSKGPIFGSGNIFLNQPLKNSRKKLQLDFFWEGKGKRIC
jgi:hypothetical protein